jgi:hypothetical protein
MTNRFRAIGVSPRVLNFVIGFLNGHLQGVSRRKGLEFLPLFRRIIGKWPPTTSTAQNQLFLGNSPWNLDG